MKFPSIEEIEDKYRTGELCGWKYDPVKNAAILAAHRTPVFCAAAPALMDSPNYDTFHYRLYDYVMRRDLKFPSESRRIPQSQVRGTCGGQGNAGALNMMNAIMCYLYGFKFPGFISAGTQYTAARVEIGNSPGKEDGVIGSDCSQVPLRCGILFMKANSKMFEGPAFTKEVLADEQQGVKWTETREGVPANLEQEMKKFLIENVIPIRTPEEAGKAIQNGNMVAGGTNLIPDGKRDSNGYSRVKRTGGHWTFFGDVRWKPNSTLIEGLLYYQSWGVDWGTGPKYPDDMPLGTVWVSRDDVQAMLNERDYYAFIRPMGLNYTGQVT